MHSAGAHASLPKPPDASSVLYFIYGVDGDGATSYEVQNGSVATFWYGHSFEVDGVGYYTGFAWATPEKYGKPGEDDVGPTSTVTLSEATFTQTGKDPARPWVFKGMEWVVGEIGAYGKPSEIDTQRRPIEYTDASGKHLLALPTTTFDAGNTLQSYDVLVFNPRYDQDKDGDYVWRHLGTVITGTDNAAECDGGQAAACISNQGTLSFEPAAGSEYPGINVTRTGTIASGADQTRALGPSDTQHYVYDAARKTYLEK